MVLAEPSDEILCIGEILWDSLPAGLFLGGAPFNVAGHLRSVGVPSAMVSRVGHDRLGEEALRRARRIGVATDLVQVDPALPTGFVTVELDESGCARYDIVAPAAWDSVELTEALLERAAAARALVFGTLAQRGARSRATLHALLDLPVVKVYDVNLRPPYDDHEIVEVSMARAEVVKLNEAELRTLGDWFGLPEEIREASQCLAEHFGCRTVCLTRGSQGAAMLCEARWTEHPGYPVHVCDTVGAGDAFLAGFLTAYLEGGSDDEVLRRANLLGAFVASRPGAIPPHDSDALRSISASGRDP